MDEAGERRGWGDVDEEIKFGKVNEKHAVPFLRVFGSNYGEQWVPYGACHFGSQDEQGNCRSFFLLFECILEIDGDFVFGKWKLAFKGEGLEKIAYSVSKHTTSWLRPGTGVNDHQPVKIESITFSPYKLKGQA